MGHLNSEIRKIQGGRAIARNFCRPIPPSFLNGIALIANVNILAFDNSLGRYFASFSPQNLGVYKVQPCLDYHYQAQVSRIIKDNPQS